MSDFVNTLDLIGDEALTKALIEKTVTEYKDDVVGSAGHMAFCNCTALTSVDMPNAKIAHQSSFSVCSNLTNVNLPNATGIGFQAFYNCTALTKLDLPKVSSIDDGAFQYCGNLKTLILRKDAVCKLGNTGAFMGTPFALDGSGGKCLVPSSRISSYRSYTNWSVLYEAGTCLFLALEDYTVDGTITGEIDWRLLSEARTLMARTMQSIDNEDITAVRYDAFKYCSELVYVNLPNAKTFGGYSFDQLKKLKTVSIPSATRLESGAFRGCEALEKVVLPAVPPTLSSDTFQSINSACVFYIPTGSLSAYQSANTWSSMTTKYSFVEEDRT